MRELFTKKWNTLTVTRWSLNGFMIALVYTLLSRDTEVTTVTEGQLFIALMISLLHADYTTEKLRRQIEN